MRFVKAANMWLVNRFGEIDPKTKQPIVKQEWYATKEEAEQAER